MLDIIAPHQDQLTLAIERKSVDQTQTGLPGATAAGNAQTMSKHQPIYEICDEQHDNDGRKDQRGLRPFRVRRPKIT
jgi:hypothetical protein